MWGFGRPRRAGVGQDWPLSRLLYVAEKPTPILDSCRWPGYPSPATLFIAPRIFRASYASELAATPTTDAINASAHCLLLLRPTLGNDFCRPRSCLRFPLPPLPAQDW